MFKIVKSRLRIAVPASQRTNGFCTMTKERTKSDLSVENDRADKLTIVLIKQGRTMSDTLTMPEPNTMAFGGVPTGRTKANEHANVVGNIRVNGCRDIAGA